MKWRRSSPRRASPSPSPAKGAERVLVVDDEEIIQDLMVEILALGGIEAECLSTGSELLTQLGVEPAPDVLILDLSLPDAMGEKLLDQARRHWKQTCFILCTGHISDELDAHFAGRVHAILRKPFTPDELLALFDL